MDITEKDNEVTRWTNRLDEVARSHEATWGIDALPALVSDEMAQKWKLQTQRLNDAIISKDLPALSKLVEASIRGWAAMDKQARDAGKVPRDAEAWDVKLESGFHLRITKNNTDAKQRTESGVYVWTLQEVARVIEKDFTLVSKIKQQLGGSLQSIEKIDFTKGDELPW